MKSLCEIETYERFTVDGEYNCGDWMTKYNHEVDEIKKTYVLENRDDREFVKSSSVNMTEHNKFKICIHFE
jgi:hypothetical protein